VHFHEAASFDTVVDLLGTAIALDDLGCFDDDIVVTPVAIGGGTVTFSHGTSSNPAYAILEIFRESGIITVGGNVKDELTTPTGASMLVNLVKGCSEFYPPMKIQSIGYGAGQKDFEGFSNVLKIVRGVSSTKLQLDTVKILETNVDDVSGEVLGNMIEKIMAHGAKDVTISSAITSIFLYAASFACISYSTPTKRNIHPNPTKNTVPPIVQSNAPVINPYSQSPKKNIGIPIDNPNNIGIN